jgi:hypothetical protein
VRHGSLRLAVSGRAYDSTSKNEFDEEIAMAASSASSSNNDPARGIATGPGKPGREGAVASAPNEARASIEIEARKATAAVDLARRKLEADEAAAQLVAATVLPLNATDARIDELALAELRVSKRVGLSKRVLATAEEAAKPIVEQAARAARDAARREAFEDHAEIIERFQAEYPEAVGKLWLLFAEAHAAEMAGQRFSKDLAEGEESFISAFRFSSVSPPVALRVQVIGAGGVVMWQGDQNSDVASHMV